MNAIAVVGEGTEAVEGVAVQTEAEEELQVQQTIPATKRRSRDSERPDRM
jgi:hypothetical protein